MCNLFRTLHADEIDARIGQVGKGYVTLLLYKDARCDQNILDETVGPYNWQRTHGRDNANCIVSIWDNEKKQWIAKEDVGTESKTEAEKGLASDSFKRACVNWGIGRELYTGPRIFISGDVEKLKKERFKVAEIGYNDKREINLLAIADKAGTIVYRFGNTSVKRLAPDGPVEEDDTLKPGEKLPLPPAGSWDPRKALSAWCTKNAVPAETFAQYRNALIIAGIVPDVKSGDMTPEQFDHLIGAIKSNYGDALGKTA